MKAAQDEEILQCKEYLIANNPAKLVKQGLSNDEIHNIMNVELAKRFNILFQSLQNTEKGTQTNQERLWIVDSFAIWFLRTNQFLTNKKNWDTSVFIKNIQDQLLTIDNCHFIFEYVVDFWNDGSNALLNALRDLFAKFLHTLKLVLTRTQLTSLFTQWMDQVLQISSTLRVQYYLIEILAIDTDMYHILEKKPKFIAESLLLMSSESLSQSVGKCLYHLLINIFHFHFQSDDKHIPEWIQLWGNETINLLHERKYMKPLKLYLLTPLFKQIPSNVFTHFIQDTSKQSLSGNDPAVLLSLLEIGQELDINDEPFLPGPNQLISIDTLEQLLDNDEFKLSAFELLTFNKKKSKPVPMKVLHLIRTHLRNFTCDTNLETRNYFESSFKSLVLRVRDSCYSLRRDVNKLQKANKFPEEQKAKLHQIDQYKEFMIAIYHFLKMGIIPGTQYQRILMSLNIIIILLNSGLDSNIEPSDTDKQNKREWPFNLDILTDTTLLRLLIDNLINPVNDIRKIVKLLLSMANEANSEINTLIHSMINESTLSEKASQSMNAYQNTEAGANIEMFLFDISNNQIKLIKDQLNLLTLENSKTQSNPLDNVVNNISGCYISLTMFLESLKLNSSKADDSMIADILNHIEREILISWDISKELMCHDDSDGLLPKKYLQSPVSDQIITSYAFRTVKEMSRLLDVILNKFILTSTQMIVFGDLLISQLFSIRHSGCFQAVLPTFRTFCMKCRQREPAQLKLWLDDILKSLEVKTQHITRRSGGIPFLITNILATETSKDRPELKYVFDKLLSILENVSNMKHQDKLDIPQINAFNCIKAIFIEAKLSEACTPYFPVALEYSLNYFKSDIWALRNCSLMLFTSLQNRIFGKMGKTISARLFFTKYQGIDKMLLEMLTQSIPPSEEERSRDMESTILILSILMCLKQTPGYDGLTPFISEIVRCLGNKNWKIRDMAARTLAVLVDENHSEELPLLEGCDIEDQDKLHGHLLACQNILPLRHHQLDSNMILAKSQELITNNPSFVTVKVYLEVLSLIFTEDKSIDESTIVALVGDYFIKNLDMGKDIDGSKQLCMSYALSFLLNFESLEHITILVQLGLESDLYEVQLTTIQYIETHKKVISDEYDQKLVGNRLKQLLLDSNTLVTLKPFIIKSMRNIPNCDVEFDEFVKVFKESNSEACRLATMESLGDYVKDDEDIKTVWDIIKEYFDDAASELFRMAALNCLINCSRKIDNVKVIMQIHSFLQDDDVDIRDVASEYLNEYINLYLEKDVERTSDTVTRSLVDVLIKKFNTDEVRKIAFNGIRLYFQQFDIYSHKEEFEGLFEREKDNQYRNDIEQNMRWIQLITECSSSEDSELIEFINEEKSKLLNYLDTNNIEDGPLGWMHSGDVLSKIIIVRQLIRTFCPKQLQQLDEKLQDHKSHPMVFDYRYL